MAFGELSLMPDDFYGLTWNEFNLKLEGYQKRITRDKEALAIQLYYMIDTGFKSWKTAPKLSQWIEDFTGIKPDLTDLQQEKERALKALKDG